MSSFTPEYLNALLTPELRSSLSVSVPEPTTAQKREALQQSSNEMLDELTRTPLQQEEGWKRKLLVLVVDRSGSMRYSLRHVLDALESIVHDPRFEVAFEPKAAVIAFNYAAELVHGVGKIGDAEGGTNILGALQKTIETVQGAVQADPARPVHAIVVSDGDDDRFLQHLKDSRIAPPALPEGAQVTVSMVQVGQMSAFSALVEYFRGWLDTGDKSDAFMTMLRAGDPFEKHPNLLVEEYKNELLRLMCAERHVSSIEEEWEMLRASIVAAEAGGEAPTPKKTFTVKETTKLAVRMCTRLLHELVAGRRDGRTAARDLASIDQLAARLSVIEGSLTNRGAKSLLADLRRIWAEVQAEVRSKGGAVHELDQRVLSRVGLQFSQRMTHSHAFAVSLSRQKGAIVDAIQDLARLADDLDKNPVAFEFPADLDEKACALSLESETEMMADLRRTLADLKKGVMPAGCAVVEEVLGKLPMPYLRCSFDEKSKSRVMLDSFHLLIKWVPFKCAIVGCEVANDQKKLEALAHRDSAAASSSSSAATTTPRATDVVPLTQYPALMRHPVFGLMTSSAVSEIADASVRLPMAQHAVVAALVSYYASKGLMPDFVRGMLTVLTRAFGPESPRPMEAWNEYVRRMASPAQSDWLPLLTTAVVPNHLNTTAINKAILAIALGTTAEPSTIDLEGIAERHLAVLAYFFRGLKSQDVLLAVRATNVEALIGDKVREITEAVFPKHAVSNSAAVECTRALLAMDLWGFAEPLLLSRGEFPFFDLVAHHPGIDRKYRVFQSFASTVESIAEVFRTLGRGVGYHPCAPYGAYLSAMLARLSGDDSNTPTSPLDQFPMLCCPALNALSGATLMRTLVEERPEMRQLFRAQNEDALLGIAENIVVDLWEKHTRRAHADPMVRIPPEWPQRYADAHPGAAPLGYIIDEDGSVKNACTVPACGCFLRVLDKTVKERARGGKRGPSMGTNLLWHLGNHGRVNAFHKAVDLNPTVTDEEVVRLVVSGAYVNPHPSKPTASKATLSMQVAAFGGEAALLLSVRKLRSGAFAPFTYEDFERRVDALRATETSAK